MDVLWTEIIIKTPVGVLERAEAALHMATPLGLYIEDYSDLESAVLAISDIDLIDDELIRKDRGAALLHVYFQPGLNRAECAAVVRESMARAGFTETLPDGATEVGNNASGDASGGDPLCGGASNGDASGGAVYTVVAAEGIAEEDWANNWKRYFKPLRIGKGILVVPEWEAQAVRDGSPPTGVKAVVGIDPGMAFGTGGHATTKMCLEFIEKHMENAGRARTRSPVDVLDLGCGSGILSIAAVLLGASSALGVDIDVYATRNAAENAARNGVSGKARFVAGNLFAGIDARYDIILANIVADVVIRLLKDAGRHLRLGGALILSGIIADREADVAAEAAARDFLVEETRREEGWTAFLLRQQMNDE